ncbi:hypothetical protein BGZ60DRAFT_554738 [Tricladium varicosporioides]|nr:hypothetical protein BGZ60DRAFT_554738 [Hymenoscyphus varicosporioides]
MLAQNLNSLGKGHFRRNKSTHKSTFKKSGESMHRAGNKAIRKGLDTCMDTIISKLEQCKDIIISQIWDETEQFFEQHTREPRHLRSSLVSCPEKRMLSADIVKDIQNLASSWATNTPVPEKLDDDPSEDEIEIDCGRFINIEKIRVGAEEYEDYIYSEEDE